MDRMGNMIALNLGQGTKMLWTAETGPDHYPPFSNALNLNFDKRMGRKRTFSTIQRLWSEPSPDLSLSERERERSSARSTMSGWSRVPFPRPLGGEGWGEGEIGELRVTIRTGLRFGCTAEMVGSVVRSTVNGKRRHAAAVHG